MIDVVIKRKIRNTTYKLNTFSELISLIEKTILTDANFSELILKVNNLSCDFSTDFFKNLPKKILKSSIFVFNQCDIDFGDNGNIPHYMTVRGGSFKADWSDVSKNFKSKNISFCDKASIDIYLGNVDSNVSISVYKCDVGNGIRCKDLSKIDMDGDFAMITFSEGCPIGIENTDLVIPGFVKFEKLNKFLSNKLYPLGGFVGYVPQGNGIIYLGKENKKINKKIDYLNDAYIYIDNNVSIGIPNDGNEYYLILFGSNSNSMCNIYNESDKKINIEFKSGNYFIKQKNESKKITKLNILNANKDARLFCISDEKTLLTVNNFDKLPKENINYVLDEDKNTSEYIFVLSELLEYIDDDYFDILEKICNEILSKDKNTIDNVKSSLEQNKKYKILNDLFSLTKYDK